MEISGNCHSFVTSQYPEWPETPDRVFFNYAGGGICIVALPVRLLGIEAQHSYRYANLS
jgi:hypothetical protein